MAQASEQMVVVISSVGIKDSRVTPNMEVLNEAGFLVLDMQKAQITPQQASLIAPEGREGEYLDGPVVLLRLRRRDAYAAFEKISDDLDDVYGSPTSWMALRDQQAFFPETPKLERTLVLAKPGISKENTDIFLQAAENADFVVISQQRLTLSVETAGAMLVTENPEELAYLSSGPSQSWVLERLGAVDAARLLLGPENPIEHSSKDLVRSNGIDLVHNLFYCSESVDKAKEDIASNFLAPFPMERTLAIVKPHVCQDPADVQVVRDIIQNQGFTVLASQELRMSAHRATEFYGADKSDARVIALSSGPCLAMVLAKPGAASAWKKIVSKVLRPRYGYDEARDGFHCSSSADAATTDIDFFFPQLPTEANLQNNDITELMNKKAAPREHGEAPKSLQDVLVEGLTQMCRVKPLGMDAVKWLGEWLVRNNPNKAEIQGGPTVEVEMPEDDEKTPRRVCWAVGSCGSGRDEQTSYVTLKHGYEMVNVSDLLNAAESANTDYGMLISQARAQSKPVPAHVVVGLVEGALSNTTTSNKFVVNGFPQSLEQALELERRIGAPDSIVVFDCSNATAQRRWNSDKSSADPTYPETSFDQQTNSFKQTVEPVLEHYSLFKNVVRVNTDGPEDQVAGRVSKMFA